MYVIISSLVEVKSRSSVLPLSHNRMTAWMGLRTIRFEDKNGAPIGRVL
jgi:hypothetical protein